MPELPAPEQTPLAGPRGVVGALRRNLARVRRVAGERGWLPVAGRCLAWGPRWAAGRVGLSGRGRFTFADREYELFRHPYHYTWLNERAVELPVFRALLAEHEPAKVLEVGNVLAHYGPVAHRVVDRYEHAPHVENIDVLEITADRRYDLIVSISTLEHVGVDEDERDPHKAVRAVEHLRDLLAPGGQLVLSVPVAYNHELERALLEGDFECRALTRHGHGWREVTPAGCRAPATTSCSTRPEPCLSLVPERERRAVGKPAPVLTARLDPQRVARDPHLAVAEVCDVRAAHARAVRRLLLEEGVTGERSDPWVLERVVELASRSWPWTPSRW